MKNSIFIILFFAGLFTQAQQQQLIENTWYLEKLVIDEIDYFPPSNDEVPEITVEFSAIMFTSVCNEFGGDVIYNDENNTFTSPGWSVTFIDCVWPENTDSENIYFYEFWSIDFQTIPNPFHYEITSNGEALSLVVTNSLGSKAYYNNAPLSTADVLDMDEDNFQLAFQKDELIIQSSKLKAKSISIYDLAGKLVLVSEVSSFQKVNTSGLPKGIYIVKIVDEKGNTYSKKIRKRVKI